MIIYIIFWSFSTNAIAINKNATNAVAQNIIVYGSCVSDAPAFAIIVTIIGEMLGGIDAEWVVIIGVGTFVGVIDH